MKLQLTAALVPRRARAKVITTPMLLSLILAGSMSNPSFAPNELSSTANVRKVAEYYEAGPRIRVEDLPERVQKRYEATGVLRCGSKEGSAQLTSTQDLITTAAHILIDPNTCKQITRVESCTFTVRTHRQYQSVRVRNLVASGFSRCELVTELSKASGDWAVLKLDRPLANVTPYQVDELLIGELQRGDNLTAVAHSADFVDLDPVAMIRAHPKYANACQLMDVFAGGILGTTCAAGEAASGGSLLAERENPRLVAITVGDQETKQQEHDAIVTGIPNKRRYDKLRWATYYKLIAGDFLDAIKGAAYVSSPSTSVPNTRLDGSRH